MRKSAILGILVLALASAPGRLFAAFTFEAHPGLYSSYEYTDNYRGEVRDARSEGIYYVGPSLAITGVSPTVSLGFTGRYARSYHNRFPEDDSPEIALSSYATHTIPRLVTSASYDFIRSLTRDSLSEPFGEHRTHTGSVGTTWQMTPTTSLNAGYGITAEDWIGDAADEEDVMSNSGSLGMTHRLNPLNTLSLSAGIARHDYEDSEDVTETNGSLRFDHAVTPALSLGLSSSYNHEEMGDLRDEDRYDERLTGRYAFPHAMTLSLDAGYSWLVTEFQTRALRAPTSSLRPTGSSWVVVKDRDRATAFVGSASLDKELEHDRFSMHIAREYTSEFTTDLYGTYETTSGSLVWEKDVLKGWTSTVHLSMDRRRPTGDTDDEEETDTTGSLSIGWNPVEQFALNWSPLNYVMISLSYEYLRTEYETSGTARENRYRVMVEVRY